MMNAIKIICTGYSKEIPFNKKTKIIQGKFLNIRVINFLKVNSPTTSVLRKSNNKYNITPPNSNVSWKFFKKWQEQAIFAQQEPIALIKKNCKTN